MAVIDDFIKSEESKMSWGDKLFMFYPKVRSTPKLTDTFQHLRLGKEKIIKPATRARIGFIIFLVFSGMFVFGVIKPLLVTRVSIGHFLGNLSGMAIVGLLLILVVRNPLTNKKYNFIITVDYEGISIDDNKFYWIAIDEMYIMSRHEGKRTNYYLLIVKKDATIEKFDLYAFGISSRELSTIIEYYRTGQKVS